MPVRYLSALSCAVVLLVMTLPRPAAAQPAQNPLMLPRAGTIAPAQITTFILHDSEGNEIEIVQQR